MASRGLEGSALPSVMTSHLNDNKPAGRGAPPCTGTYLDFEGNIQPISYVDSGEGEELVTRAVVRGLDRKNKLGYSPREAVNTRVEYEGSGRYNNFNYWRRNLPDVSSEISYILRPGDANFSPDVNGNRNLIYNSRDARRGIQEKRVLEPTSGGRPRPRSPRPSSHDSSRYEARSSTPYKHRQVTNFTSLVLFDSIDKSNTDDDRPGGDVRLAARDDDEDAFQYDDETNEKYLLQARHRLKSSSFSDYSRYGKSTPVLGECG